MTCVSSVHKIMTQYLFFYWSLKRFYDEKKYSKEDKEFVKAFNYITEEKWATIQEVETLSISVTK